MISYTVSSHRSAAPLAFALMLAGASAACAPARPVVPAPVRASAASPLAALGAHTLVPAPVSVLAGTGPSFALGPATAIVVSRGSVEAARVGEALAMMLRPASGLPLPVSTTDDAAPRGAIALRLGGPADLGAEGYELVISADSIRLTAAAPAGLYHGVQTLRQLLPAGIEAQQSTHRVASVLTVPPGRIVDRPRFAWRGAMLDVARHFFTVDEVQQYIDVMALYKLNMLHLHLSDDQGWRIQIDSWPKLTTVGAATQVGGGPGGFFTKQDYATLVQYASDRFITVVPEIDMPGHTNAAIAAYPELGCSKPMPGLGGGTQTQPPGVYTGIQVGWSTFCPDSEVTYRFVDDVMRELAQMTPGPYLHIGGDEVHALPPAQYVRFVERVQNIVYKYGKTMVGWEEVGNARLRPTTLAQQWKSDSVSPAVRQGALLILSPATKSYLDMKYTPATELGLDWSGFVELRTAYDWNPATYLNGVPERAIAGVEAALWTETVQNMTAAQFLIMPRLPAIAEVGWSPEAGRDWEMFRTRLAAHAPRWRLLGINYYASPQVAW